MDFQTLKSKTVFTGRVFAVRQDELQAPDGRLLHLDVVVHGGAVTLVPLDADGQIWFIRQYRHPAGKVLLELPAGVVEAGEDPVVAAAREIREEIGMAANELKLVGSFFLAPGYSTEFMHVYVATGLHADALEGDEDEYISVEKIPLDRAYELAETGGVGDAKSLGALMLARRYLMP